MPGSPNGKIRSLLTAASASSTQSLKAQPFPDALTRSSPKFCLDGRFRVIFPGGLGQVCWCGRRPAPCT